MTNSKSEYIHIDNQRGWGNRLAAEIDTTPLAITFNSGGSPTVGVMVTVVWREFPRSS